jgi:hypothetical protein
MGEALDALGGGETRWSPDGGQGATPALRPALGAALALRLLPPSSTVSRIRVAPSATTRETWPASRQGPGEESVHGGDGLRDVPFRTQWERPAA